MSMTCKVMLGEVFDDRRDTIDASELLNCHKCSRFPLHSGFCGISLLHQEYLMGSIYGKSTSIY